MGSIYRPTLKSGEPSRFLWIKYSQGGRVKRESAKSTKESEARQLLKLREGAVAKGEPILPRADRIRYEEARADLQTYYEASGKRDLREFARRVQYLDHHLAGRTLASIGQPDVDAYVVARQGEGIKSGTCRRELGSLTKMLRLAYKNNKLARLPLLDKPAEGPARAGFFEADHYAAVLRQLPADLQAAVSLSHTFGWRMQSEVLPLERRLLDLVAGTLSLDAGSTKNGDGRLVYLTPELKCVLSAQVERVKALERTLGRIIPYLFPHLSSGQRAGQRRADFRKAWATACRLAGVPGRYRHDLRRTAVRNMEQQGVPRSVAMKLTGHRTESVYRRYAIVSPSDLQEAARKLSSSLSGSR